MAFTRRGVLVAGYAGGATFVGGTLLWPRGAHADDEIAEFVRQQCGQTAIESDRIHLVMPAVFPTGYTVPLSLDIESPMTEADHVKTIRVFAPQNPIVEVAGFQFRPLRGLARVSTRIRLAKPQFVVVVADMSDGALQMAKTWVNVATNGCT